ncbi:MAG: DUF1800 domain-containing protein, partial [Actinobacteria bacterium]|nr:DUF1800 domain-containing protein [Actinomycetota bacterium]
VAAGVAAAGAAPAGVALAAPAAAAVPTKRVTKFVALAYRYDRATDRTTVTKATRTTVTVQVTKAYGRTAYKERNAAGAWVLVPYVWSAAKAGLVYDHGLRLQLTRASSVRAAVPYVTRDLDLHLLRRATFGPAPGALAELRALGRNAWVDRQLAPATIDDRQCDAWLAASFSHLDEPIWHVNELLDNGSLSGWRHQRAIASHQVARQCWSKRQLLEVMVEFWSQLFNVDVWSDTASSRAHYARTLRARAFGSYADLLWAVVTHPAMLVYLNNAESTDEHPNENLGRELLELHSVGVGSPYGEAGVLDCARVLTGLSVSRDSGEFLYAPWKHWVGPVRVLAFTDPNPTQTGGLAVARRLVTYLAHHEDTAWRIARRLAVQFVADAPPQALVDRLARLYLAQGTRIAPVLRELLTSPEFEAAHGAKVRRPQEYLVSVVRTLGYRPTLTGAADATGDLAWLMEAAGMSPLARATPDGYPLKSSAWLGTAALLGRWNGAMDLVQGWTARHSLVRPGLQGFLFGTAVPATCGAAVDAAGRTLFGAPMLAADRDALLAVMGFTASTPLGSADGFLSWRLEHWVAAMLQTPYQLTA